MRLFRVIVVVWLSLSIPVYAQDLMIDLRYEPTAGSDPPQGLFSTVKLLRPVRIAAFADRRTVADRQLGDLRLNGQQTRVLSRTDLAPFVTDVFQKVYGEWGGKSSPDDLLQLRGEITQFRLEETDGYQMRVGFHFYLLDENSRLLWDGHTSGIVRGSGRRLAPESVPVMISDILRTTFAEMLEDSKLVGVWSGRVSNTYAVKDNAAAATGDRR